MTLDIFFERYLLTLHAIVVAFGLIIYVGVARALPQRRDPSAAIAWVVALALLPYVAVPLYLMFGSRKLLMRDAPALLPPIAPAAADDDEAASLWARRLARSMGLAPAAPYAGLHLHADGAEARRAVLDVIAGATRTLDVCTFILARDRLGDEIAAALRAKAEQGVRVRLLIDGIGAWLSGRLDVKALRRAGVDVVTFVQQYDESSAYNIAAPSRADQVMSEPSPVAPRHAGAGRWSRPPRERAQARHRCWRRGSGELYGALESGRRPHPQVATAVDRERAEGLELRGAEVRAALADPAAVEAHGGIAQLLVRRVDPHSCPRLRATRSAGRRAAASAARSEAGSTPTRERS